MGDDYGYEWLKQIIRKKKKNRWVLSVLILGAWVGVVAVGIFALFIEDGNFSRCTDFQTMDISDLNVAEVKAHPYVRIYNACMHPDVVFYSKDSKEEYFYLLEVCDTFSRSINKVVVSIDDGLDDMLAKGDTMEVMSRFLTGKLMPGLPGETKVANYIRNAWHIRHTGYVYTLYGDYTPTDEWNGDWLAIGIMVVIAAVFSGFIAVRRKVALKEIHAWEIRFYEKYPNG